MAGEVRRYHPGRRAGRLGEAAGVRHHPGHPRDETWVAGADDDGWGAKMVLRLVYGATGATLAGLVGCHPGRCCRSRFGRCRNHFPVRCRADSFVLRCRCSVHRRDHYPALHLEGRLGHHREDHPGHRRENRLVRRLGDRRVHRHRDDGRRDPIVGISLGLWFQFLQVVESFAALVSRPKPSLRRRRPPRRCLPDVASRCPCPSPCGGGCAPHSV